MQRKYMAPAVAALTVLMASEASAGDDGHGGAAGAGSNEQGTFMLGFGLGYMPDYEGGDDYEGVPVPFMEAKKGYRYGKLFGVHATSNLINHPNWRLGPSLNYRQGYGNVENYHVEHLTDRGHSFEAGLKGGYQFHFGDKIALDLALETLFDISSGHEGIVVTPSIDYLHQLTRRWSIGVGVKGNYASGEYMSHFFSVNRKDSLNSGLEEYDADSDFKDASIHATVSWDWTKHWSVVAVGEYKRMLGDAEDSPVVDDEGEENQYFGALGMTYTWN